MTDSGISLDLRLLFTGFYKVDAWWDFRNLTSSFYRLYYISKGECEIKLEDELFHLHEGDLFLIPKLVRASYHCDAPMEQYYICLLDGEKGSCAIADPTKLKKCLPSSGLDAMLFKRLADISPEYALWSVYPEEYDNKKELLVPGQSDTLSPVSLERKGIIPQLFSRFLTPESLFNYSKSNSSHVRISYIIKYINDNLSARLSVSDLADILSAHSLCPDHFLRPVLCHEIVELVYVERLAATIYEARDPVFFR